MAREVVDRGVPLGTRVFPYGFQHHAPRPP